MITRRKIVLRDAAPIGGIDVGEDYLDLALLSGDRSALSYHRVALVGLRRPIAVSLAARIADAAPALRRGALALVDSPRAPRDADCARGQLTARANPPSSRRIDSALRELLRRSVDRAMRLSMFPTPPIEYFARCIESPGCKPHLRAIGEELLASVFRAPAIRRGSEAASRIRGGLLFTRFMLVGFAVFPALEELGLRAFECYPDLQFRLWQPGSRAQLPSKRFRARALAVRTDICARLARAAGTRKFELPATLDQADAAVLALSAAAGAARGSLIEIRCAAEGRFAVALAANEAHRGALDKLRMGRLQRGCHGAPAGVNEAGQGFC